MNKHLVPPIAYGVAWLTGYSATDVRMVVIFMGVIYIFTFFNKKDENFG